MKRVIDGKRYDTDKATYICDCSRRGYNYGDFRHEDTGLYRTANGRFFLAGEGGPMSRWAQSVGNGSCSGEGIEPLDANEAMRLVECYGTPEDVEKYFAVTDA